ncbi:hypothetical protein SMICM304S_01315 [Streptomyces microflavus]
MVNNNAQKPRSWARARGIRRGTVGDPAGRRGSPRENGMPRPSPVPHPGSMNAPALPPRYEIRALHTATTVTVYQAYRPAIGLPAARDGRFPGVWKPGPDDVDQARASCG